MSGLGSGTLDREITIQRAALVQSESGESRLDWDHATEEIVWAQWLPMKALESYFAGNRLASHATGVFRIYDMEHRPPPESSRILWDGRIWDVEPYVEGGRKEFLDLLVKARGE